MKRLIILVVSICLASVALIYGFYKLRTDLKTDNQTNAELKEEYETLEDELDQLNEELEKNKETIEEHQSGTYKEPDGQFNELAMFQVAADVYGIDYKIPYAISKYETANFNSSLYLVQNNPAELIDGLEYLSFDSKQEGIDYFVKMIAKDYIDKGYDTIEKIQEEFRPDSKKWAEKVQNIYDSL